MTASPADKTTGAGLALAVLAFTTGHPLIGHAAAVVALVAFGYSLAQYRAAQTDARSLARAQARRRGSYVRQPPPGPRRSPRRPAGGWPSDTQEPQR